MKSPTMYCSYAFVLITLCITSFSKGPEDQENNESHHNQHQQEQPAQAVTNPRFVAVDQQQNEFGAQRGIIIGSNSAQNRQMLILLGNHINLDMLVEIFGEESIPKSEE